MQKVEDPIKLNLYHDRYATAVKSVPVLWRADGVKMWLGRVQEAAISWGLKTHHFSF